MNKLELLNHLHSEVYCRLMPSPSHGVGVFAVRPIPEGVDPFPGCWNGDYHGLTDDEVNELPTGVQSMIKAYCVNSEGLWWIPDVGLNRVDVAFFLNHGASPNVATRDGESFVTTRAIESGEELLVDYNTYSEGLSSQASR